MHGAIGQCHRARPSNRRQRMFAPVFVVAIRVILVGMRAPAFLARLGTDNGGQRAWASSSSSSKRFHQIAVPDQASGR